MKALEKFVKSKKGNNETCEDEIFISNDFVAIVDGATSKGKLLLDNKTSGKIAAETLIGALSEISKNITAYQAIEYLTDSLSNLYKQHNLYDFFKENRHETPTASIVIFSVYRKELWMVGDCQAMIDGVKYTNEKLVDLLLAQTRSFYLQSEIIKGAEIGDLINKDTGREFIMPLLQRQYLFQNTNFDNQYHYAALDGFHIDERDIKIYQFSNPKKIILASDGYPELFDSLKACEDYLQDVIEKDPLSYKLNLSTKGLQAGASSFDDRSYISVELI